MDKNKALKALAMLREYKAKMSIDYFALAEQTSKCVNVVLVDAEGFINAISDCIDNDTMPTILTIEKGEEFFRLKRIYSGNKMWGEFRNVKKIRFSTNIAKIKDMPKHKNMQSRGFEIVVSQAVDGEHTGDDITKIDVVSLIYGNIECKFGYGRLYTASNDSDI